MRYAKLTVLAISAAALVSSASARTLTAPLSGAELVTTGEGRSCVVVSMEAPDLGTNVSLGDVQLRLPRVMLHEERELMLHVRVLTSTPYTSVSDLDEELVGRVHVPAGGLVGDVDLRNLLRGVLGGREMHGLVITTPGAAGFASEDADAVLAAVRAGTLYVSYRGAPPPPRSRG
jgi:hypothetical protein